MGEVGIRRFGILFTAGAVVLVIGLILQWYPNSVVLGLEERLDDADVDQDERAKIQGALNSWQVWQITTFQPMSSILFAVGILIIVYSIVSGIFTTVTSYKLVRKEEE